MKTHFRPLVGGLTLAMAMSAAHAQVNAADLPSFDAPNVYVMSNGINANSVAILKRNFFGGLNKVAVVPTGGKGVDLEDEGLPLVEKDIQEARRIIVRSAFPQTAQP